MSTIKSKDGTTCKGESCSKRRERLEKVAQQIIKLSAEHEISNSEFFDTLEISKQILANKFSKQKLTI